MQKLLTISFVLLMFVQSLSTNIEDYFNVLDLLEHYNLHNKLYGDGFTIYLSKHFGNLKDSHREQDQRERNEYPSNHHDCISQGGSDLMFHSIRIYLPGAKNILLLKSNFYYKSMVSKFEKQKIFQPPKLA